MEKGLLSFWIQLILTVVFFETGSCIRCHSCISLHEPKCADPVSWELIGAECTIGMVEDTYTNIRKSLAGNFHMPLRSHEFHCFKMNVNMKDYLHNRTTIRGCQYARTDRYDPCIDIKRNATEPAAIQFCETCSNYNECNGSNPMRKSSLLTSVIIPLFAILFLIRQ